MTITIDRYDYTNLMIACEVMQRTYEEAGVTASAEKWKKMHEKLGAQLLKHDKKRSEVK